MGGGRRYVVKGVLMKGRQEWVGVSGTCRIVLII